MEDNTKDLYIITCGNKYAGKVKPLDLDGFKKGHIYYFWVTFEEDRKYIRECVGEFVKIRNKGANTERVYIFKKYWSSDFNNRFFPLYRHSRSDKYFRNVLRNIREPYEILEPDNPTIKEMKDCSIWID